MSAHELYTRRLGAKETLATRKRSSKASDEQSLMQPKSACSCGGTCPSCQTKSGSDVKVSRPGDASEREADRIADRVVHGQSVAGQVGSVSDATVALARDGTQDANIASSATSAAIRSQRGMGQTLNPSTQARLEERFGADFSAVRVHADTNAARLSEQLNARAFTVGNDVYFGRGRFDPESSEGQRLLAHELTHVVQQGNNSMLVQRDIEDEAMEPAADSDATMIEEEGYADSESMDARNGGCTAQSNKRFLLANFVDFEFTVPSGCSAVVTFRALWVPVGESVDCCTGADTYDVTRNSGNARALPVGPNICGADTHPPGVGTINTGSGRQRFHVQVDRRNCEGIKMQLAVNIRIR